jgi:hypothetical protein
VVEAEQEERVAFMRKHAADLEEESRKNASGEGNADIARQEEEEALKRKVSGMDLDERRKRRRRRSPEPDEDEDEAESDDEEARAQTAQQLVSGGARGSAFEDAPPDRMGDPTLLDPNEMKRVLGPSVRFAQHAMILAEKRREEGASRSEAIGFLAGLYQGLDDREYAGRALRAFGPGTGILDIYPLEVMQHLLEHVPGFFSKTRAARIFGEQARVRARPGVNVRLAYAPALRIRGFALEGGPRPGYCFEPVDPPGHYQLRIDTAGTYRVLISAITRDGWLLLDEIDVAIDEAAPRIPEVEAGHPDPSLTGPETPSSDAAEDSSASRLPDDLSKLHFPRRI